MSPLKSVSALILTYLFNTALRASAQMCRQARSCGVVKMRSMNVLIHFVTIGLGSASDNSWEGEEGELAGSAKRGCKLSLTGTAKRSTTRDAGRLSCQILSCSSGGRRAN